ncbi:hypothetical protein NDU88_007729 [Pleurodeles waltl]|uniref:Uncharacterized protein n=1 Tax=Pleurodeles waltl TaxID=8319 RepID=A0AAV7QLJ3_PLEWA|nr:hypothetical protein NDU88_007729 [Pleurodeles waltl]
MAHIASRHDSVTSLNRQAPEDHSLPDESWEERMRERAHRLLGAARVTVRGPGRSSPSAAQVVRQISGTFVLLVN